LAFGLLAWTGHPCQKQAVDEDGNLGFGEYHIGAPVAG